MSAWPPQSYQTLGREQNVPDEVIKNSLYQAQQVLSGLPPVLTLNHLAVQADVTYTILREVVERRRERPYRQFTIRKRRGSGLRWIFVAEPALARVHKWIAHYILRPVPVHPLSFAYAKGGSILAAAKIHLNSRWLVKLDIASFFESISERQVYHVFRLLGYQPLISFEMARICTRIPWRWRREQARWVKRSYHDYAISSYDVRKIGYLPQGAATSPMLSNLVMKTMDDDISRHAINSGLRYSRYADDLTFSTPADTFDRTQCRQLIAGVSKILLRGGFHLRGQKTVVSPPGARKMVLGLLVDKERPRLSRVFRRRVEQEVYGLEFGPAAHAAKRGFQSVFLLQRYLEGLLIFASHVDSGFANPLWAKFHAAFPDGCPIAPL